jgi:hypothetical protein
MVLKVRNNDLILSWGYFLWTLPTGGVKNVHTVSEAGSGSAYMWKERISIMSGHSVKASPFISHWHRPLLTGNYSKWKDRRVTPSIGEIFIAMRFMSWCSRFCLHIQSEMVAAWPPKRRYPTTSQPSRPWPESLSFMSSSASLSTVHSPYECGSYVTLTF